MKEKEELKKEIDAVLFAAGRKVSTEEIAKLCKSEKAETEAALKELKQDYEQKNSPLLLTEEADGYKLIVREKYLSIVKDITPHTELNRSMMETLAVVAWKQPVLQAEVIKLRTSKAYEDIKGLVEMGFISKDKHGRSYILKPTGKFFEYFDLPSKEAVKEIFKDVKDVEPEVQKKLEGAEKIGEFEVYEAPGKKKGEEDSMEEGEQEKEPKEKLGNLDVFTEEEGEAEEERGREPEENEEEEKPITGDTGKEKEETDDDEEKARKIMRRLAEGNGYDEGQDEEESTAEEEGDEGESEESKEEEKPKKKKRLSKELEEFAGIEDEDKEKEKDGEE